MKKLKNIHWIYQTMLLLLLFGIASCTSSSSSTEEKHHDNHHDEEGLSAAHLSIEKVKRLGIKIDTIPHRTLKSYVLSNGHLEVAPQHQAIVTAIVGTNIKEINVIEGERVKKGEVLGYVAHPHLIELQVKYLDAYHKLQFVKEEYQRKKRLFEDSIISEKEYQKMKSTYYSSKGTAKGLRIQLHQLGMNVTAIQNGTMTKKVAIKSPIKGYIKSVNIKIGQYVPPQKAMFEIINLEHLHVDLMVFENDVSKIKKEQTVSLHIPSVPNYSGTASLFSIGKNFEENPKALHLHAELKQKADFMIPGLYVTGKIEVGDTNVLALPQKAVVHSNGKNYIFLATKENNNWMFEPIAVKTGQKDGKWIAVSLLQPVPKQSRFAWNNGYKIISEIVKEGNTHHH